ncbi:MAG TPA: hypothetical protein VMT89_03990, partial [Candidatus Acidoferrales bacterium]|nr:hypothetical protein [Candidatus Acidoferrales bacterium]
TATDIAPGATNGFNHIFVRDRVTGRTESLSINSDGIEGNGDDFNPIISGNGRYVGWTAGASNYIHGDSNANFDAVVHDLVTGTTEGVSVDAMGGVGNCGSGSVGIAPAISDDGRTVAFSSDCTNFVAGDTNGFVDVYVHGPNAADAAADLTGDGDRGDTVLEQFDTTTSSTRVLCPANQVSIVAGAAAFLRPEAAGPTNNANCSGPTLTGPDLNGDGDSNDEVVHLAMPNGSVQNLGIAATLVSMSGSCSGGSNDGLACTSDAGCPGHAAACVPTWLAAAVPSSSGAAGEIQVHKVGDAPSVPWTATGRVADALQMVGNLAVFITPEAAQNKNLNGDGDKNDRVLQIYDAAAVQLTNVGDEAEEFVIGSDTPSCAQGPVVAFHTSEAAENQDLNGDGDKLDEVMQLYVPGVGVIHTGQAVTACNLAACDPRFPYRVSGSQVKFLTYEGDQSADLNGDGDQLDIVLQIYDVCARTTTVGGTIDPNAASTENPLPDTGKQTNTDSGASAAVVQGAHCVSGSTVLSVPATCTIDADCPTGATCTNASIVAAPAVVPQHDSVLLVPAPVNLTIGAHALQVSKTITVKVRNGDIKPAPEKPGHVIRLTASDGTCPVGTVQGLPDFDGKTPGDQDSVLLKGGATKSAKVSLLLPAAAFPTLHNSKAPYRCNLDLAVSTATAGNADPNPRNDTATVELNVVTLNGATSTATHESVIKSLAPVQLAIPASGSPSSKTVKAKLVNADSPAAEPLGHDIQLSTSDGDCPPGTVSVVPPATQTVRAGGSLTGKIAVNATASGFTSRNGKSPARCTATISAVTAVPGNLEPDPSNNTTNLIIDVNDKSDAPQ